MKKLKKSQINFLLIFLYLRKIFSFKNILFFFITFIGFFVFSQSIDKMFLAFNFEEIALWNHKTMGHLMIYSLYINVCILYSINYLRKNNLNKGWNTTFLNFIVFLIISFVSYFLLFLFTYDRELLDEYYAFNSKYVGYYGSVFIICLLVFFFEFLISMLLKEKINNILIVGFFIINFTFIIWGLSAANPKIELEDRVPNILYYNYTIVYILSPFIVLLSILNIRKRHYRYSKGHVKNVVINLKIA